MVGTIGSRLYPELRQLPEKMGGTWVIKNPKTSFRIGSGVIAAIALIPPINGLALGASALACASSFFIPENKNETKEVKGTQTEAEPKKDAEYLEKATQYQKRYKEFKMSQFQARRIDRFIEEKADLIEQSKKMKNPPLTFLRKFVYRLCKESEKGLLPQGTAKKTQDAAEKAYDDMMINRDVTERCLLKTDITPENAMDFIELASLSYTNKKQNSNYKEKYKKQHDEIQRKITEFCQGLPIEGEIVQYAIERKFIKLSKTSCPLPPK